MSTPSPDPAPVTCFLGEGVPLAPHTTLGLGGPARYWASCARVDQVRACLPWARRRGLPVQVLGGGSNVVFADEGFEGLVLHVALRGVERVADGTGVRLTAAAGETWDAVVEACVADGLAGVECLSGIPGQVGATPIQNVGAYGQEVSQVLVEVQALDRHTLREVTFPAVDCGFGYRHSRFRGEDRDRYVITRVALRLEPQGRPAVRYAELRSRLEDSALDAGERGAPALRRVRQAVLALRREKSMVVDPADPNSRSAGSFFLNPRLSRGELEALRGRLPAGTGIPTFEAPDGVKVPAAWLIERAGFPRGLRLGGAAISDRHALALVNRGATARQLLALAARIQEGVQARFGVRLEPEPVILGPRGPLASGALGAGPACQ
ncbi:MAG: UDP-N-acetylmuramate dehydrogenase [Candidatus Latescibacterota bacterium]